MKVVGYIIILIIVIFGVMFAMLNSRIVEFNYYFGEINIALSLLLAISLLIGVLLGCGVCLLRLFTQSFNIRRLQRRLDNAEQEIRNLRHIPIKDKD